MKTTEITGKLSYIERARSSANGNPRYAVSIDIGNVTANTYLTGVDASVGYEVENFKIGRDVVLTLTVKRDNVVAMRYAGSNK